MWILTANKSAKFHAKKKLNQSENIPKRFRGLLFINTLYSIQKLPHFVLFICYNVFSVILQYYG